MGGRIAVVEYGMGNVGSVLNMLRILGADAELTSDPERVAAAEKIILPGVGAFDTGMANLAAAGLVDVLHQKVREGSTPLLGLCLGMHLITNGSEEGSRRGLGWIDATTVRFQFGAASADLKVPHMGWNTIRVQRDAPLVRELLPDSRFYFVHSFHVSCRRPENVAATTLHGYEFPSVVQRGHIMGTQFHPEKSHRFGMKLLQNFVRG